MPALDRNPAVVTGHGTAHGVGPPGLRRQPAALVGLAVQMVEADHLAAFAGFVPLPEGADDGQGEPGPRRGIGRRGIVAISRLRGPDGNDEGRCLGRTGPVDDVEIEIDRIRPRVIEADEVALGGKLNGQPPAPPTTQVDGDAPLADVEVVEHGAVFVPGPAMGEGLQKPGRIGRRPVFDLDHLGPEQGQPPGGGRPVLTRGEVADPEPAEGRPLRHGTDPNRAGPTAPVMGVAAIAEPDRKRIGRGSEGDRKRSRREKGTSASGRSQPGRFD